jgi:hypothetical protein
LQAVYLRLQATSLVLLEDWKSVLSLSYREDDYKTANLLTPWKIIFFEKLIDPQLVKKFLISLFQWNLEVDNRTQKRLPSVPVMSQMNPIHTFQIHFWKNCFNINVLSMPKSSEFCLTFGISNLNALGRFYLHRGLYTPRSSHHP